MIALRVLGPLEVTVDGTQPDLGGPRQRCVLARLVAEQGRVVSADRLIEDLYADEAPPRALAAVQSYVSHLRRALEPGRTARAPAQALVTSPPGYALRLSRDAVDAWSFEDQVHEAAGLDDPGAAHARLTSALAGWRGPAFGEFSGLAWADLEAARLEELRLTATEQQAEAALRLGRAAGVVADLSRLAAEQPLREETWRLLALALYQSGRQGDALAALRRARTHLSRELGVDPGPALRSLEDDILSQAPHLSVRAPRAQPGGPPGPEPADPEPAGQTPAAARRGPAVTGWPAWLPGEPYVGRDHELGQAIAAAAEAAAGRTKIVLVTGEAGAGKTALAEQVRRRLAAEGWTVAAGRCREDEGAPPGWPWAEALRQLSATAAPADPEPLAPLLADSPPRDDDVAAARFRMHRAMAAYLEEVSSGAPLLVVLDDLHRADGETLAILASITADLAASRALVLATYRPAEAGEPLSACLASMAGREPVRITLGGLDADAASQLIRATCQRPVNEDTALLITERTGGNAFFIRETARLLDSEGTFAATTGVPAGVREVLQRRIARLPATAQTMLGQAAVIGAETGIDVLADVSGAAEEVALEAVEAALVAGLVTEPEAGRIRFAHALVRDTLYDGLSRLRRSRLHARAAQAIERHSPADVAALAYHFSQSGTDPAVASHYCRLAAEQAELRFAYHEAARLWEQAISCLDQAGGADPRDRLLLVLGLVRALASTSQLTQARSMRADAIRAALPIGDPALVAEVITAFDAPTLWPTHEYHVTDHELIEAAEQTVRQLPPGDQPLRARLLATLAFELDGAKPDRGYQASAEALKMARRIGDPGVLTVAINGRYLQSYRHDGLQERLRLARELLALPGKPVTALALAHVMLMTAHSGQAGFGDADLHAAEAWRIAVRYDLPAIATRVSAYQALRAALAGHPDACQRYEQATEQMTRLGMWQHGAALALLGVFCVHVTAGRAGDSAPGLERMHTYQPWTGLLSEMYALSLAASGRVAQAREVAGHPVPVRRDMFWLFMTGVRGLLGVAIDDRDRAESSYQALLPFSGRPAGADTGAISLWPAAQILGDLARYLGLPGAGDHYRQALAVADQAKVGSWAQEARRRLGAGAGT